jgi:hypothetical protein
MSTTVPGTFQPATVRQPWNYQHVLVGFAITVILQGLFLPCLCNIGQAKSVFGWVIDLLVAIRIAVAYLRKETGRGWLFYVVLLYTSPVWITLVAWIVLGGW